MGGNIVGPKELSEKENNNIIKYENPKIMLVDMDKRVENELKNEGFDIEVGTFGVPYASEEGNICGLNGSLPYIDEKEIVIVTLNDSVELTGINPLDPSKQQLYEAEGEIIVSPKRKNYFDGRPMYAYKKQSSFRRILENGGILIVFSDSYKFEKYHLSIFSSIYGTDSGVRDISNHMWLPDGFNASECNMGKRFLFSDDAESKKLAQAIIRGSENEITYACKFSLKEEENTNVLLKSHFGEAISYIRKIGNGILIVLPKFENYSKPILNLFKEILPELKPNLFPDFVKNSWIHSEEYMFPEVKKLTNQKEDLIREYNQKLENIEENISSLNKSNQFLTNILLSQGVDDFLVENVKKVLEYIGYTQVIDVDKFVEGNKQEDLRILDEDKFTVVEIKGHKGHPSEDDCQALYKYINRNKERERRFDVHGILIINHQRMIPPLEREDPGYTKEQIDDAKRDKYTLVTTWELFKAIRLLQTELITFKDIDASLHKPGLFSAIPSSWKSLGKIHNIFKRNEEGNIACYYLEIDLLKKGDILVIEDGNNFFKQQITEMKIDDIDVDRAKKGDPVSIKIFNIISKQADIYVV